MRYECKYRKGHQFGRPLAPRDPRLERPGQKRSAGKCPKTWTGPHKEQNERHRYSNDSMGAPWVPTSHPKMLPSGAQTRPNLTGTPKDYVYTFFQLCMLQAIHISVTWWLGKRGVSAKRQKEMRIRTTQGGHNHSMLLWTVPDCRGTCHQSILFTTLLPTFPYPFAGATGNSIGQKGRRTLGFK